MLNRLLSSIKCPDYVCMSCYILSTCTLQNAGLDILTKTGFLSCINLMPFILYTHALSVHPNFREQPIQLPVVSNIQGALTFPSFCSSSVRRPHSQHHSGGSSERATTPNPPGILGTFSLWFQVTTYTH